MTEREAKHLGQNCKSALLRSKLVRCHAELANEAAIQMALIVEPRSRGDLGQRSAAAH